MISWPGNGRTFRKEAWRFSYRICISWRTRLNPQGRNRTQNRIWRHKTQLTKYYWFYQVFIGIREEQLRGLYFLSVDYTKSSCIEWYHTIVSWWIELNTSRMLFGTYNYSATTGYFRYLFRWLWGVEENTSLSRPTHSEDFIVWRKAERCDCLQFFFQIVHDWSERRCGDYEQFRRRSACYYWFAIRRISAYPDSTSSKLGKLYPPFKLISFLTVFESISQINICSSWEEERNSLSLIGL